MKKQKQKTKNQKINKQTKISKFKKKNSCWIISAFRVD